MTRSRFSEEQIIGILKEHPAGPSDVEFRREHGVNDGTFFTRRSTFDGMDVSEAGRLKALEEETQS